LKRVEKVYLKIDVLVVGLRYLFINSPLSGIAKTFLVIDLS
jgi:hypothetical protein